MGVLGHGKRNGNWAYVRGFGGLYRDKNSIHNQAYPCVSYSTSISEYAYPAISPEAQISDNVPVQSTWKTTVPLK